MSTIETQTVDFPLERPDGSPVEPFELRDAVQLATFRLFDLRDPATERITKLPLMENDEEQREIVHADPFTGWHLPTFRLDIEDEADSLRITASCARD